MNKIKIHGQEIEYELRKSRRAKRMRVAVYRDSSVVVTLPYGADETTAEKFLRDKASWLTDKISYFKNSGVLKIFKGGKREYLKNKEAARVFARKKVEEFNGTYKLKYNKITIKRQKTRWGSCSRKGNLNYNYRILFLPERVADYIIVHELCHLGEFNHSRKFWALVGETMPDYLSIRRELKSII